MLQLRLLGKYGKQFGGFYAGVCSVRVCGLIDVAIVVGGRRHLWPGAAEEETNAELEMETAGSAGGIGSAPLRHLQSARHKMHMQSIRKCRLPSPPPSLPATCKRAPRSKLKLLCLDISFMCRSRTPQTAVKAKCRVNLLSSPLPTQPPLGHPTPLKSMSFRRARRAFRGLRSLLAHAGKHAST